MQNTKNESRKNRVESTKTQKRSLLKKFGFLWVILGAILAHFSIKAIGFGDYYEPPILITLWAFVILYLIGTLSLLVPSNKKFYEYFKESENNILGMGSRAIEENENYLLRSGEKIQVVIEDISIRTVLDLNRVLIKYFNHFSKKNVIKRFNKIDLENIPKIGDKIEILYEKNHPENSMISCEKPGKAPWYKLQKKYKIKIINN